MPFSEKDEIPSAGSNQGGSGNADEGPESQGSRRPLGARVLPNSPLKHSSAHLLFSGKNKGGWKTQGRGKHTIKPLPKNGFGPPHLWYVSPPPPVCFRPVVFLGGNRHRPGKSHFLRPPKLVLEGALYGTFSPQKIARYVLPTH